MLPWTSKTRQAAMTGKVIDAVTQRALPSVRAEITAMPPAYQTWLARAALQHGAGWAARAERPDRTLTAADGCFRFVDLPDGSYTVTFSITSAKLRYGTAQKAFVVARDASGVVPLNTVTIMLPPTSAQGTIKGGPNPGQSAPLPMARVRVRGSGEVALGDVNGDFYLPFLEPGQRTLDFSAPGFSPVSKTITVALGQVKQVGNVLLGP